VRKEEEEVMFWDIMCDGEKSRDEKVMCADVMDVRYMRKGDKGTSKCHNWGNYI
jgi:hypothetical protein